MPRIILVLITLCIILSSAPVFAKSSDWDKVEDVAQTRLIHGNYSPTPFYRTMNPAKRMVSLGIQMKIKEKWHTYWRTPGDGGIAMTINRSGSKNIKKLELIHPAPTRFSTEFEGYDPIETFGYGDEVIFPVNITPKDPEKPVHVNLSVDYAVCDEICVFHNSKFSMDIEPEEFDEQNSKLIENTRSKSQNTGMDITSVKLLADNQIEVIARSENTEFNSPDIFIEADENFSFPKPEVTLSDNNKQARFIVSYKILLDGAQIKDTSPVFTLVNGDISFEKKKLF